MLKNLCLNLNSPLEQFEVSSLISVIAPIFSYTNITLSNLGLYCILILFIIISLHIISNNEKKNFTLEMKYSNRKYIYNYKYNGKRTIR